MGIKKAIVSELRRAAVDGLKKCRDSRDGLHFWSCMTATVSTSPDDGRPLRADLLCLGCGATAKIRVRA